MSERKSKTKKIFQHYFNTSRKCKLPSLHLGHRQTSCTQQFTTNKENTTRNILHFHHKIDLTNTSTIVYVVLFILKVHNTPPLQTKKKLNFYKFSLEMVNFRSHMFFCSIIFLLCFQQNQQVFLSFSFCLLSLLPGVSYTFALLCLYLIDTFSILFEFFFNFRNLCLCVTKLFVSFL